MSLCQEDGCWKKLYARGWCRTHYYQWYRAGGRSEPKLKPGPKPTQSWEELFWAKVNKTDGCWEWTGALSHGYGAFMSRSWTPARVKRAHRISYELLVGPIPDGLTLDHLCRNPRCVRPDHLEAVPIGVNVLRGDTVSARNAAKTHCPRGHEFTPENIRWEQRKNKNRRTRHCRACDKINNDGRTHVA